ncbi:TolC family protein [uncultured Chryseobacterium sp.]|uniref:TolC family protein n=1 Tax=uncultured Chryseobacterium sp. TaxID=259322 RepID=UPI0025884007|nr:TolC family protein [uncultured Chryseobacterium sp.]
MKNLLLVVLLCSGFRVLAQKSFSLKDCIAYTLANHGSVQVYKNNVDIAKTQVAESKGLYLPSINLSAAMVDNLKLQSTVLPAGIFGPSPKEIQLGTQYNINYGIDVSQTIFDASKIVNIQAGKSSVAISEVQKNQNNENLIYNTAISYFQLLIYQEQLKILEANERKYAEMAKVLEYQLSKGVVLEKDVDRVKVNLNTTRYQIEDTKTRQTLALNTLKNTMGMDGKEPLAVSNDIDYEQFAQTPLSDELNLNNLTDNQLNELSVKLREYDVKAKKATFLPTLTAVGKWTNQSLSNDFSHAFSNWTDYSYVGLSLNMPLFSGFRRKNAVKESQLKLDNEKLNLKLNQQNLQLRFDNAQSAVTTAYTSYKSNKDNMALAAKVLSVTDYQYQRGVANLTDYLNDDAAYKAAQSTYINSLYNLMISQVSYEKSQGKLYEFISNIK